MVLSGEGRAVAVSRPGASVIIPSLQDSQIQERDPQQAGRPAIEDLSFSVEISSGSAPSSATSGSHISHGNSRISTLGIIGIALACLIVIVVALGLAYFVHRHRGRVGSVRRHPSAGRDDGMSFYDHPAFEGQLFDEKSLYNDTLRKSKREEWSTNFIRQSDRPQHTEGHNKLNEDASASVWQGFHLPPRPLVTSQTSARTAVETAYVDVHLRRSINSVTSNRSDISPTATVPVVAHPRALSWDSGQRATISPGNLHITSRWSVSSMGMVHHRVPELATSPHSATSSLSVAWLSSPRPDAGSQQDFIVSESGVPFELVTASIPAPSYVSPGGRGPGIAARVALSVEKRGSIASQDYALSSLHTLPDLRLIEPFRLSTSSWDSEFALKVRGPQITV